MRCRLFSRGSGRRARTPHGGAVANFGSLLGAGQGGAGSRTHSRSGQRHARSTRGEASWAVADGRVPRKRTLGWEGAGGGAEVRLGRDAGIRIYVACMVLAAAVPVVLWKGYDSPAWILLSLLATPLFFKAVTLLRAIPQEDGARLNGVLAMTARNLLIYTILFSLGWVVAA